MSTRMIALLAMLAVPAGGAVHLWAQETAAVGRSPERPVKRQLVGGGKWQSQRNGNDSSWHIQLKELDDDSTKN